MKLPERLKDPLITLLLGGIAGLFVFFGTKLYDDVSGPFLASVLPAISNKFLLSAGVILLLLVILLVSWVIYLHRARREPTIAEKEKAIESRFDKYDSHLGLWTHKTEPGYFCPKCKASHFESPLKQGAEGWHCPVCDKWFGNPDYTPSPTPPIQMQRESWDNI